MLQFVSSFILKGKTILLLLASQSDIQFYLNGEWEVLREGYLLLCASMGVLALILSLLQKRRLQ